MNAKLSRPSSTAAPAGNTLELVKVAAAALVVTATIISAVKLASVLLSVIV